MAIAALHPIIPHMYDYFFSGQVWQNSRPKAVRNRYCIHSMPQHILASLFTEQPVIWKNIDASQATRCNLKGFEALAD